MNLAGIERTGEFCYRLPMKPGMRVAAIIYADAALMAAMDDKVAEQLSNVARLPGIVQAAMAMPDAHWGYGFPIGGVAAFAAEEGGVVSAGGVGFDVSCGVRLIKTGLGEQDILAEQRRLADCLFERIPAGVGSTGRISLDPNQMDAMLVGGARWAVDEGYGRREDLERIEEGGSQSGADPRQVSERARRRQRDEMGTLGSGNHYLEVQRVAEVCDQGIAEHFGLALGDAVIAVHCGSRGLGHQIGSEFLREMALAAASFDLELPDRELACAPILSGLGQRYLGAMRSAINCALANRQILTHLTREVFTEVLPAADLSVLYDVSHNTCKEEEHVIDGEKRRLFVHRKGATRAFGPHNANVPAEFAVSGQPVFIGGSMGTCSYVLAGTASAESLSFSSACHGAGRAMSRNKARKTWRGRQLVDELERLGIHVRSPSFRGVAEEAPGAYKDVTEVVDVAERSGLARKVCQLKPMICIKG